MNRPGLGWRVRLATLTTGGALIAALFPMAGTALAAATVTAVATGGSAISADTAGTGGTGSYTTLAGPSITSATTGDFTAGTLTLTVPSGFEFRASGTSVTPSGAGCPTLGALTPTAGTITQVLSTGSTGACTLTFSGIGVRPTVGTSLATGDITASGAGISGTPVAGHLVEVAGAPILTFYVQPSTTGSGGIALAVSPTVKSADQFGNKRVGDAVTLAVNTGPSGGAVTCTTNPVSTLDVTGGTLAAFAGCALDKPGTYTLRATTAGQAGTIPVSTPPTVISVGSAYKLVYYQRPTLGVAGVAFPAQPVVAVADAGGNILPSGYSTNISLAITTNPAGGTLTCTTGPLNIPTALTAIGVAATFAGCRINNAGIGYVITATGGGLIAATATLDIENQLVFFTQPSGAIGGAVFTTQPVVTVQANSTIAANDSTTVVTLSIRSGTGATGATLTCSGGLSMTVVAGVAAFSGCSIDRLSPSGNPYQLVASTTTGLSSINSSTFAVTVGAATKVAFTTQPGNANVGAVFPVSPVVAIQDAGGNTITTGSDSIRSVTLAIGTNPGSGTLACTGGLTRAAVAGVATFTGCSISLTGTGYTLTATSSGLTSATSSAFNVTAPAAVISLVRSTGMVTYGQSVGFTIQFGTNGGNRTFYLEHTYVGIPWTSVATGTTNGSGFASLSYRPTRTGYYRVRFDGTPDLSAAFSGVYIVGVRQTVTLSPSHAGVLVIARGRSITFRSTVRPLRADLLPSLVTFRFYRNVGGAWVLRYERNVATDTAGVARTTFRFGVGGSWYVRAFTPRTPYNSISRYTQREVFRVL